MMTLDLYYECETEWDIYVAAKEVELLLTETYSMKTDFNKTISSEFGDGYTLQGKEHIIVY
jgi:hypothetical protein